MPFTRLTFSTLLAAAGFALLLLAPPPVPARQPAKDDLPKRPSNYSEVSKFKNLPIIPASDLKQAKEVFAAFAKYNADYISHPKVYTAPQEFRPDTLPIGAPPPPYTLDQIVTELNRHILVPVPANRVGPDQADYIRELGSALDDALKKVIDESGEPVVRVNATRLLAAACRSGAHAHYPTITGLITNANTRPEVKYYAFEGAANLLAAYDLNDIKSRKHSHKPKEVSDLIAALQDAILKPGMILPVPAGGAQLPPDQQDVLVFIRRQAVRALAQVRFADKVPGGPDLYPAFTLARIAVSDPAISPPPTDTEVAEAVIGICNMTPPRGRTNTEPYAYAMADAVATGILTFATRRAANPQDRSAPWKGYAVRLNEALKLWRALFDGNFDPTRPTVYLAAAVPKPVEDVAVEAERRVLTPMEGTAPINLTGMRTFRDTGLRAAKAWTLAPFAADPKLVLPKKD